MFSDAHSPDSDWIFSCASLKARTWDSTAELKLQIYQSPVKPDGVRTLAIGQDQELNVVLVKYDCDNDRFSFVHAKGHKKKPKKKPKKKRILDDLLLM